MERNYSVYKHTTPSGKIYIGLTKQTPTKRWDNGHAYKCNPHFWNAIQRYGWDNITHEVLYDKLTRDEACALEKALIAKYDSTNQEKGYNVLEGGTYGYSFSHTEAAKQKISKTSNQLWQSEEHRNKMSEFRRGENNPFYGRHHSAETIVKMKQNRKPMSPEQRENAGQRLGAYWKGKTRSKESVEQSAKSKWKPVAQYSKSGELIRIWDSAKIACETLNIHKSTLSQCCKGIKPSAGGYVWKYT